MNNNIIKKSLSRWSVAPLALLRTTNLPFKYFENLEYSQTIKNFERRLGDHSFNNDWSEKVIKDFENDELLMKRKLHKVIDDHKFWEVHYPFIFKHGPYILSDKKSFSSFPVEKFTADDFKLFYKRIMHMATKHNFSFNFNTCVPGRIGRRQSGNIRIPLNIRRAGKRILLERWAQKALKNQLGLDVNLKCSDGHYFFKPAFGILRPLERVINKFVDTKSAVQERRLLENAKKLFYSRFPAQPDQRQKRFREMISFIRVSEKKISVGDELADQIQTIADHLGILLENFSQSASDIFLSLVKSGVPRGQALERAAARSVASLSLRSPGRAQGFFFGFDFMLCAASKAEINKGNYEIVLSDVNIFPGGFEIFLKDKTPIGKLAEETVQRITESMHWLSSEKSEISFLNDWEALDNNQRWCERIKALDDFLRSKNLSTRHISYYPNAKNQRVRLPSLGFWFLRQGFFSSLSGRSTTQIERNIYNRFFFSYAIQHRKILGFVLKKLKTCIPAIPIRTRRFFLLDIDFFLDSFCHKNCFFKTKSTLSDWFKCFQYFHDRKFLPFFFVKSEETKRFPPLCINLKNVYSFKILVSSLKKIKKEGIRKVLIEEMAPVKKDFWLSEKSTSFPCEIRTFIVKSPIVKHEKI